MHERNTFLKFITLVCELMTSTNRGLSKSAVKLSQAKENSMKEMITNYLSVWLAKCICAVHMKCVFQGKSHTTVYCVPCTVFFCGNVRRLSFMNKLLRCHLTLCTLILNTVLGFMYLYMYLFLKKTFKLVVCFRF